MRKRSERKETTELHQWRLIRSPICLLISVKKKHEPRRPFIYSIEQGINLLVTTNEIGNGIVLTARRAEIEQYALIVLFANAKMSPMVN